MSCKQRALVGPVALIAAPAANVAAYVMLIQGPPMSAR